MDVRFDIYRETYSGSERTKLTKFPISESTNFIDTSAGKGDYTYVVQALSGDDGRVLSSAQALKGEAGEIGGLIRVKLDGEYSAFKVGLADFDGDGKLDYLIKQPAFNVDPSQASHYWKKSPEPYKLEAYRSDGSFMWRYDMGWAIETGTWYSPVIAYDVDGDGKAEVYTKAGEGDPRDERGQVHDGPEYLVKIDGTTGKVVEKRDWPSRDRMIDDRVYGKRVGDGKIRYSYFNRNQLGLAYLDGEKPHILAERGTYTNIKFDAYDSDLNRIWQFEAIEPYRDYRGQGAHGMQIADIDGDGRDEIVFGAAALDDDGKPLWTTGRGHPDVCYVADIDPSRPGLEVFYGHEWKQDRDGLCLVDARTGDTIWGHDQPTTHIHSQGMVSDIDPTRPGLECYGGEKDGGGEQWLYSATGELISTNRMPGGLAPRAAYWGADKTKWVLGEGWEGSPITFMGELPGNVVAIVDCIGDWREELIVSAEGEIRIYSTTVPTQLRQVCLMQDRQYRVGVALQTMGYYYPPFVGGSLLPDIDDAR